MNNGCVIKSQEDLLADKIVNTATNSINPKTYSNLRKLQIEENFDIQREFTNHSGNYPNEDVYNNFSCNSEYHNKLGEFPEGN